MGTLNTYHHTDAGRAARTGRFWRKALLNTLALLLGSLAATAGTVRTQEIPLTAGWNAVFLEVQPDQDRPGDLFTGLPVATVTCLVSARAGDEFLRRPGDAPWRAEHWAVWRAPGRPEAFLSNLQRVVARRAYLIEATAAFTWRVQGETRSADLEWEPNGYTLTGLPVAPGSRLTLAEFFGASGAHAPLRAFRLVDGEWQGVRDPAAQGVRAGEAYWIETRGASRYQGPVSLQLPASGEIDFDVRGAAAAVRVENLSLRTSAVRLEVVGDPGDLPLTWTIRTPGTIPTERPLPQRLDLPELPAGATLDLRLAPDRAAMQRDFASVLLRFSDGRGWERWVPVRARREAAQVALQP